jgi:hypothetical protein
MPSTVVHLALAGLIATALLGRAFGPRTLAVALASVVVVDMDTFAGLWMAGAHRALFHNLVLPAVLVGVVLWDTRYREDSWLRTRFEHGPRVAWVSLAVVVFAGVGPDLFFNGVNVFYPLHDQFYKLDGEVLVSNQRGFVQTFVDLSPPEPAGSASGGDGASSGGGSDVALGSTQEVHYRTGVDPRKGSEPADVERVFPVVRSGQQALVVLTSTFVMGTRLVRQRLGYSG